jgi:beta-galactosidase
MYVCNEANIETHGMKPSMGRLAHDRGWQNTFVSRITRLVQRDRNHASVICWSLGNEAGRGRNFVKAREHVRDMDPTRPIVYESGGALDQGTGRTELTDVICTMYPSVPRTINLATRADEDRPVILCEYSHAMGNSNGNLHLYWNEFWDSDKPRLQGGFIWDMIDQGLRIKTKDGFYFGYGGDFDDPVNDLQFCINGMFSPDREPHPAVNEIKFLQQPVVFSPHSFLVTAQQPISLEATNRYTFRQLDHLAWSWTVVSSDSSESVHEGTFAIDNGRASIQLGSILSKVAQNDQECSYFLNIRGRLNSDTSWATTGHVLVKQQFPLSFAFERKTAPETRIDSSLLVVSENEETISVSRQNESIHLAVISKSSGSLVSYCPQGDNVLDGGITPNFTRAATDNVRIQKDEVTILGSLSLSQYHRITVAPISLSRGSPRQCINF